jgi:hypothetical protein
MSLSREDIDGAVSEGKAFFNSASKNQKEFEKLLSGEKPSSIYFRFVDFPRGDLKGVDFKGLRFTRSIFDSSDFSRADLKGCIFSECSFINADFSKADLREATFQDCKFSHVKLEGAKLRRAAFKRTDLTDTDFSVAEISQSTLFEKTSMTYTKFSHSQLRFLPKEVFREKIYIRDGVGSLPFKVFMGKVKIRYERALSRAREAEAFEKRYILKQKMEAEEAGEVFNPKKKRFDFKRAVNDVLVELTELESFCIPPFIEKKHGISPIKMEVRGVIQYGLSRQTGSKISPNPFRRR